MTFEEILLIIEGVSLFRGMKASCIRLNLSQTDYQVKSYKKGEIVALEGEECEAVGMILSGGLELRKEFPAGHYMTLTYLERADIFGEVMVFSPMKKYPATIVAVKDTEILCFNRVTMLRLMEGCESILKNFMALLSGKILMLNKKTSILSFKTIEEKVASYVLEEYKLKGNRTFNIPLSRKELAGYLNVPRPSLSRTMSQMKADGLIDYYQNTIQIIELEALEECLFK